jgi:succinate dehydrogenase/fumarate reductase-like Fe-S protein
MSQTNRTPAKASVLLAVSRGIGDGPAHIDEFEVPLEAAASLLDGLRWVREHADNTLAFRYSCINANACKECMMHLDGKVVYACLARLQGGATHRVAPLPNKPRLRDLVTEIAPGKERLLDDAATGAGTSDDD